MNWQAESLHCVAFHTPDVSGLPAPDLFSKIFGSYPLNFNSNPAGAPPMSVAAGAWQNFSAALQVQPGRIEIILSAPSSTDDLPDPITDIPQALSAIREVAVALVALVSPVRLALVANMFKRHSSPEDAVAGYRSNTGVPVPSSAIDLTFGINVRKAGEKSGVSINRIARWGTGVQQIMMLMVGHAAPTMGRRVIPVETLMLDINSVQQSNVIGTDICVALLDDLVNETKNLISGGYDYLVG
ncbi:MULTISPECIES: hypothetical protein [unclassified Sphingomonas]|nr:MULTISPECIES: hypothetical protein [unclassified Sphingomonas]